jgi:tetratricopeptide (TPR) repeat protein
LRYPFQFDGIGAIKRNKDISDVTNLAIIWDYNPSRFITFLSFAINHHFGGLDTFGYNLFDIVIHAANTLLVFHFIGLLFSAARRLSGDETGHRNNANFQFAAALLFAVHPIQTEAVTYIWQRSASMASLFYLMSMTAYLRASLGGFDGEPPSRRKAWIGLSVASALAAMFTKQIAFTLPFALALMEFCLISGSLARFRERAGALWPYIPMTAIIPFLTFYFARGEVVDWGVRAKDVPTPYVYLITQFNVIAMYLRLMVYPAGQNLDYDFPLSASFLDSAPAFLLLASLLGFGIWLFKRNRMASFGILFFFLSMSVESSFFPVPDTVFEHRMYLPVAGLFIAMAALMAAAGRSWGEETGRALIAAALMAAIPLALATRDRNKVWETPRSLWEDVLKKSPNKGRALTNMCTILMNAHEYDKAIPMYKRLVQIDPNIPETRHDLGALLRIRGDLEGAEENLKAALALRPKMAITHLELGRVHEAQGRLDEAGADYVRAINNSPRVMDSHFRLADLLIRTGNPSGAEKVYKDVLRRVPGDKYTLKKLSALARRRGEAALADEYAAQTSAGK